MRAVDVECVRSWCIVKQIATHRSPACSRFDDVSRGCQITSERLTHSCLPGLVPSPEPPAATRRSQAKGLRLRQRGAGFAAEQAAGVGERFIVGDGRGHRENFVIPAKARIPLGGRASFADALLRNDGRKRDSRLRGNDEEGNSSTLSIISSSIVLSFSPRGLSRRLASTRHNRSAPGTAGCRRSTSGWR